MVSDEHNPSAKGVMMKNTYKNKLDFDGSNVTPVQILLSSTHSTDKWCIHE